MAVEREVKLGAWAGFELPDLTGVADGVTPVARATQVLDAVYHDTPDLKLARWGITVRHRSGEGSGGWTVKLPDGDDGLALVRRELGFEGSARRMPAAALTLLVPYVRGHGLVPVAHMKTVRNGFDLVDGEGTKVAEVVDDEVSVLHAGHLAIRFREVEVELGERAPADLLDAVVECLRGAGAGAPDPTPKVFRALGPRALQPPDVQRPALDQHPSAADLVRQAIAASVTRVLLHDPGVRIGDDPEDVHQARVGTRRLRSDLRTFAPLLDDVWVRSQRRELAWLAGCLGAVRDADVMVEGFRAQAERLGEPDTSALAPVFRQLAKERDDARAELLVAMDSARYVGLLDQLVAAANEPPCRPVAAKAASKAVPRLASRPWRKLAKTVRALPDKPSADDLHQVRIAAKAVRYAAEAWLQGLAPSAELADSSAVDHLIELQRAEAARQRKRWRWAWKLASNDKLRSWL